MPYFKIKKHLFYLLILQVTLLHANVAEPGQPAKSGFGGNFNISHVSVNNGLTQNSITSIIQDKRGFIWIGTYDGLNRFDGLEVQQKRHESGNKYSLTDNRILCLFSEENGNLLVGTEGGGIIVYDWKADNFHKIKLADKRHEMLVIKSICKDKKGRIWLAGREGILIIEKEGDKEGRRKSLLIKPFGLNETERLFCDHAGNIWIGTPTGLYLLDTLSYTPKKIREGHVLSIFQDRDQIIWYGGYGNLGLVKLIGNNTVDLPSYQYLKSYLFKNDKSLLISDIVQDAQGKIWLTTDNLGLFMCDVNKDGQFFIKEHYHSERKYGDLPEDNLNCAFVDNANNLWLGTFQSGAAHVSLNQKSIYGFLPLINSKQGKYVTTVHATDKNIWIGTLDNGLLQYSKENNGLEHATGIKSKSILSFFKSSQAGIYYVGGGNGFYRLQENGNSQLLFSDVTVRSVCEDNFGRLWLATWSGIIIYDPVSETRQYITEKNGISSNTGYALLKDNNENVIWYGTIGGGLNKFFYDKTGIKKTIIFKHQENSETLSNNHIWNLYKENRNKLWIGTDAGLNLIENDKVKHIMHPLLRNRKITSIIKDEQDNLWLSTGQGLIRYNEKTDAAKLFTYNDGLLSNTLTEASFLTPSGNIYIGSINGLNAFNPQAMSQNPYLSQTAFTAIKIYEKKIEPNQELNGRVLLEQAIDATEEIRLKHNENNFTLSLAALHFSSPAANRFRYRLVGYDKGWMVTESGQTSIGYSHLPAGEYTLEVTSSNNDGIWNKDYKTLNIIVAPAPWLTWWAKTYYTLLLGIFIWYIYAYYDARRKIRKQVFVEKYEKEKLIELNELKLDFFTNITHEIRTPLSLIIGPANDLVENEAQNDFISKRINIIHKNALRLYNLINQVLDLRKISGESDSLGLKQENMLDIIVSVKNSFALLAESRGIILSVKADKTEDSVWVDREKMEKVLYNLISNAFNYSEDNKPIDISLDYFHKGQTMWARINIEDRGKGISTEDLVHIFDMYYQSRQQSGIGSGIGLAVAKKLIEIQNGTIQVESIEDKGSTFIIEIPVNGTEISMNTYVEEQNKSEDIATLKQQLQIANHTGKDCILIVEDDPDLLSYITETLKDYTIIKASNAVSGLELAKKFLPQLIISDLLMPGMNGQEFLKEIKNDVRTNHIPVIIHSVKYDAQTIKDILKAGADDFIPKPVNYKDFESKVRNILHTRKKLIEAIHKNNITNPKDIIIPSADEEFLAKVFKYIESNISNPDLSVEKLSSEMAMSRMSLHRKLEAIIGKTASELIREIRMKIAGQLLASGSYRISEVMFEVGISSNHYFNKYFKDMYNMSPKEYIALHQKKNT